MVVHPRRCGTILMESFNIHDVPNTDGTIYSNKACYNGQVQILSVSLVFTVAPQVGGHYTTEMIP